MSLRWLEVRIPISPIDHYFNRVHFIAHSIRSLDGPYRDVPIRVMVGTDQNHEDLYARFPWSRPLGIDWHWVDHAAYVAWKATAHPYIATMMERFRPPFVAKNVLMLDADVLTLQPFNELFEILHDRPCLIGVMAHVSPFGSANPADHTDLWRKLYRSCGLGNPKFEFLLSGWGLMDKAEPRRLSPPYFNTGMLLSSAAVLEKLYEPYMEALLKTRNILDTYFIEQIALTLALIKTGLPYTVVPLRYNFPNDPRFDDAHDQELNKICFLHFLRTEIVRREDDFKDNARIELLIKRADLSGSNELFRRRIAELAPLVFTTPK